MPPGGDNICEKSSQFHFVNEYLYKPLNLEEHQSKPNISLRYSDRYYPENYYSSYEEEDESPRPQKQPVRSHTFILILCILLINFCYRFA